ncbi:MAG TPA: hypothetical protein VLB44_09805 [Kofleriaceae bacterium]|nr:hypothetical protein [Kofleriaceae bacterium]
MSQDKDPNQGEGDRISARRYDNHVSEFVAEGKVPDAAKEARNYVERDPEDAVKAEERAKRGPFSTRVSVDELVAKGHTVIERIRPVVDRMVGTIRSKFGRK